MLMYECGGFFVCSFENDETKHLQTFIPLPALSCLLMRVGLPFLILWLGLRLTKLGDGSRLSTVFVPSSQSPCADIESPKHLGAFTFI
jgi:hypothetical protein